MAPSIVGANLGRDVGLLGREHPTQCCVSMIRSILVSEYNPFVMSELRNTSFDRKSLRCLRRVPTLTSGDTRFDTVSASHVQQKKEGIALKGE